MPTGMHLGGGSSSPMAADGSPGDRSLPHRKRSFIQMLLMDNPRDVLDSAQLEEMGAVYVGLLSTTFSCFFFSNFILAATLCCSES